MTTKSRRIAEMIAPFQGLELDARYVCYFDCFNRRLYFEAHDVLEELWLAGRSGPNHLFYKGLIQLAGAFVHLQKGRLRPAAALLRLAGSNLKPYPEVHERLEVGKVLRLIEEWTVRLESGGFKTNPLGPENGPKLELNFSNHARP